MPIGKFLRGWFVVVARSRHRSPSSLGDSVAGPGSSPVVFVAAVPGTPSFGNVDGVRMVIAPLEAWLRTSAVPGEAAPPVTADSN